jgi:lysophospholipase L1-like esterase
MRRVLENLAAIGLALLVSLAAGEALLRAVVTLPLPRTQPEVRYQPHPVRRFTLAPSQDAFTYGARATIDARGFRSNGSTVADEEGDLTVLALGDSFTFGLGVADEETWPAQLESRLRRRVDLRVTVVNAGTISYGTFQELDLLRSALLAVHPRVVVHALYWNDFMNAEAPAADAPKAVTDNGYFVWDPQIDDRGALRQLASWMTSRSAMLFSLRAALDRLQHRGTSAYEEAYARMLADGLSEVEWAPIEHFYREVLALAKQNGFKLFVVILPVDGVVARGRPLAHPLAKDARRRLQALGVPYLDGFTLWDERSFAASDFLPQGADSHLSADGYAAIANALAEDVAILLTP